MTRASTETILSLDRFAAIMGINPAHFASASATGLTPVLFPVPSCSNLFYQYDWQAAEQVSREQIAMEIARAEEDIAKQLGYYPGPKWIYAEEHAYPRPYRREYYGDGANVRGDRKSVELNHGSLISLGRRASTLVGVSGVAYTDADGDGFAETATINIGTTNTDKCELKVYFSGHSGDPEWEIRPARTKVLSGGIFSATFYSWQFIDPDLWEELPSTETAQPIDISNAANLVTTVDVYREYVDTTVASVQLLWENYNVQCTCGGSGCDACSPIEQDGCANIRDGFYGIISPLPASYSGGEWSVEALEGCREPDRLKVWYYAGEQSQKYLQGRTCEPLSDYWARIIAFLAVSRLEHEVCSCDNVRALSRKLREDVGRTQEGEATFIFATPELVENPFGSRMGEVMAWRAVTRINKRRKRVTYATV